MERKVYIFIILIFIVNLRLQCQDIHNSNYRYSPLFLNPALSGNFSGNLRLTGTFRDQGQNLLIQGYKTLNLALDMPISFQIFSRKNDWIGIGVQVYNDQAGLLSLSTTGINLNGAYHLAFDKKYNNVLSLGIQYGSHQRKINDKNAVYESDHVDPGVVLHDRSGLRNYKANYNDINIGLNFKKRYSKNNYFSLGFSTYHILESKSNGISGQNFINRRYTSNLDIYYDLTNSFSVENEIIASMSGNSNNYIGQVKTFYKLSKEKKNNDQVYVGLGYRWNDALLTMFGIRFKNWDVGISYDVTVSGAAQYNNGMGGMEIGVLRIFDIPKKPKVIPVLVCPSL